MDKSDNDSLVNDWLACLQASGYRLTFPRRTIIEILVKSTKLLGPADIYSMGRKLCPGLGLVTIYRTLDKLEELNLIQRVHQPNGCHMVLRANLEHQHLLICSACGAVEVFSGDDLGKLFSGVSAEIGYKIEEHRLQLFGRCPECQLLFHDM